jgi:hypothetical protein
MPREIEYIGGQRSVVVTCDVTGEVLDVYAARAKPPARNFNRRQRMKADAGRLKEARRLWRIMLEFCPLDKEHLEAFRELDKLLTEDER